VCLPLRYIDHGRQHLEREVTKAVRSDQTENNICKCDYFTSIKRNETAVSVFGMAAPKEERDREEKIRVCLG
jgi:hypothetical protein